MRVDNTYCEREKFDEKIKDIELHIIKVDQAA